eukprot:CAMPEP_0171315382 /NCGR_PEP_ID=MMETSP0816-20121228/63229_1 /TAXON_ID=420281 /ORGANISM="Proboscia inermis, Strain CCAP1064/1" /LENGTH=33 /DNA_ID= /DNA_START= /DNA_END= /DNA_ORIENTATION=
MTDALVTALRQRKLHKMDVVACDSGAERWDTED